MEVYIKGGHGYDCFDIYDTYIMLCSAIIAVYSKGVFADDPNLVNTINSMIDQLAIFAAEVKKVAREVGTEGKLGGQAEVGNVEGIWQEIT